MGKSRKDITGNRYGRLVVLYPISETSAEGGAVVWRCRCDCGRETNVLQASLVSGNKKSCGCLKEEAQKRLPEQFELVDGTCIEWIRDRKMRADNKSGCKGVFKKKNGKYTVYIGFKKKVIYLGTYETLEKAVEARKEAEDRIFGQFLESYGNWKSRAERNPEWADEHAFRFDVEKRSGKIIIIDSMKEFAKSEQSGDVTVTGKIKYNDQRRWNSFL